MEKEKRIHDKRNVERGREETDSQRVGQKKKSVIWEK